MSPRHVLEINLYRLKSLKILSSSHLISHYARMYLPLRNRTAPIDCTSLYGFGLLVMSQR